MSHTPGEVTERAGLAPARLGIGSVFLLVISAAAPLTVVAGSAPLGVFLAGNGGPGAMLVAGVVLMLFASGFTAMSRYVRDTGAFYAYVTRGLGPVTGSGTAALTVFGYAALTVGFYGLIGYFADLAAVNVFDLDLPWGVWSLLTALFVGLLGYRRIDLGTKVLAVIVSAEVLILAALSIAVLVQGSPEPLTWAPFHPNRWLFAPGVGALFVIAFGAYIGFEGTAVYAEEAKDPDRTIPVATYVAIAFLSLFYAATFYCFMAAFGLEGVVEASHEDDFALLPFAWTQHYLGHTAVNLLQVLLVTSFLACLISFHNAAARYLFSLGRSGLLPAALHHSHPRYRSPDRASLALIGLAVVAVLGAAVAHLDPYLDLGLKPYASGVIALVSAQGLCAIAVVAFFVRDRRGHSVARVLLAPGLAAIGLSAAVYLIVTNFEVVSGLTGPTNTILLLLAPAAFVSGVVGYLLTRSRASPDISTREEMPTS